jgi:hypothetical protein
MEQAEVSALHHVLSHAHFMSRKINSPYKGTLSSYGYVLLVIYFLVHVKNPPVLPNLQQVPPLRPIPQVRDMALFATPLLTFSQEETHLDGHNIWYGCFQPVVSLVLTNIWQVLR